MSKAIYTTKQAAEILGVTQRTIQIWADGGILSVGKTPGGHRRINAESVRRLLEDMDAKQPQNKEVTSVLLVDDDAEYLALLNDYFARSRLALDLVVANDGYEALIVMGHLKPQLIITDLSMPKLDGFHMLEMIQRNELLQDTRLCALTGLSPAQIVDAGGLSARVDVLHKPIRLQHLKEYVCEQLAISQVA